MAMLSSLGVAACSDLMRCSLSSHHSQAAITSQLRDRNLANADELIKMLIQAFMEEEVPVTPRIAHRFMEFWNNYGDLVDSDAEALMLLDRMLEAERYLHEVG